MSLKAAKIAKSEASPHVIDFQDNYSLSNIPVKAFNIHDKKISSAADRPNFLGRLYYDAYFSKRSLHLTLHSDSSSNNQQENDMLSMISNQYLIDCNKNKVLLSSYAEVNKEQSVLNYAQAEYYEWWKKWLDRLLLAMVLFYWWLDVKKGIKKKYMVYMKDPVNSLYLQVKLFCLWQF